MDRAPKNTYPIQHVQLLMDGGEIVKDAHWAQDLSGEEQPPFIGWFIPDGTGRGYREVRGEPRAWAPMPIP